MLDRKDKHIIKSAVWDATVGAGNDSEDIPAEFLERLSNRLNRDLTAEDIWTVKREWTDHLQKMMQESVDPGQQPGMFDKFMDRIVRVESDRSKIDDSEDNFARKIIKKYGELPQNRIRFK